jgi:hypothetical protein
MRAAAVILMALAAAPGMATDYPAPGGGATAKVTAAAPPSCEAIVEISVGSAVVGKKSYVSSTHQDGSCVAHADWTPDAKFFVFSLGDSGGHQPWNASIVVFSRDKKQFIDLDIDQSEAITDPNFTLTALSGIEFETTKIPLDENSPKRRQLDLKSLVH